MDHRKRGVRSVEASRWQKGRDGWPVVDGRCSDHTVISCPPHFFHDRESAVRLLRGSIDQNSTPGALCVSKIDQANAYLESDVSGRGVHLVIQRVSTIRCARKFFVDTNSLKKYHPRPVLLSTPEIPYHTNSRYLSTPDLTPGHDKVS